METDFPGKIFKAENNGNKRLISHRARTNRVHGHHALLPFAGAGAEQRELGPLLGGAQAAQLRFVNFLAVCSAWV
jgi:hypothetical protein